MADIFNNLVILWLSVYVLLWIFFYKEQSQFQKQARLRDKIVTRSAHIV